jgi:phosphoinositide-3-kinase regulatory subunit 4
LRLDTKTAPAVAAIHTTAIGTTTIHEEMGSGRTTPIAFQAGTPRGSGYGTSYEGHDPGVRAFLEQVDLETYREPLLDFGPRVVANHRKRSVRANAKNNTMAPITLIAHLTQHTGDIVSIVTSPDHVFFATASSDKMILVWDSARLERSVSAKARLSYVMDAGVSALCRIENTHCLAAASEDGQVHVLRVHVSKGEGGVRYSKMECIRTWQVEERDGHVVSITHLQGESCRSFELTQRLDSVARHLYIGCCIIGYQGHVCQATIPASP